jgi:hypothetical protein
MAATPVPTRLHAILARDRRHAVVIARVRHRLTATIGWDLRHDAFEVGQYVRATLAPLRSDLSPDGKHFVYFALDGRRSARGATLAYTAVSRRPWLKALDFYPAGDTWFGGGLFVDDDHVWLNGVEERPEARTTSGLRRAKRPPIAVAHATEDRGVYVRRLLRDGWTATGRRALTPRHDVETFERALRHRQVLRKEFHATSEPRGEGRGCYFETHAVVGPGGTEAAHDDWSWADVDGPRARVVFASGGAIHTAPLGRFGVGPSSVLFDARGLAFEPLEAPY